MGDAILTNWLGSGEAEEARGLFAGAGMASYETPEKAVRGFMHLVRYRRAQEQLMEVPASAGEFVPDDARARRVITGASAGWLDPIAVQDLFEIVVLRTFTMASVDSRIFGIGRSSTALRPGPR